MQLPEYRGGSSCEMHSVDVSLLACLCLNETFAPSVRPMGVGILYAINKTLSLLIGPFYPLNGMAFTTYICYDAAYLMGIHIKHLG